MPSEILRQNGHEPEHTNVTDANDSEGRSATSILPGNKNAPGADRSAPLAIVMRRAAREYRQCFREGNVAIYLAKGPGSRVEYETIEIQVLAAGQVDGRN